MATSTTQRTGSCLCGAIQLKIAGEPLFTNLCHCISCQKSTGTIIASVAAFKPEQLEYTVTPPDVLKTYVDGSPLSGNTLERSFCSICGSRVRNEATRRKGVMAVVPTGIIDGDKAGLKPRFEFFCKNREEWVAKVEGSREFVLSAQTMADLGL
ncbi:hypothetical protein TruAng_002475 [Truncatella angustata]|nr:hypothetical protein TruAng_002475 [Truncatella angustata]